MRVYLHDVINFTWIASWVTLLPLGLLHAIHGCMGSWYVMIDNLCAPMGHKKL